MFEFFENLTKKMFTRDEELIKHSSQISADNINTPITKDEPTGFYDEEVIQVNYSNATQSNMKQVQNALIESYRSCANHPEVNLAISEIVNEACNVERGQPILSLNYDGDNEKFSKVLRREFEEFYSLMQFDIKLSNMFQQYYIDGQLNVVCLYDNNNLRRGIIGSATLEPFSITYDNATKKYTLDKSYLNKNYNYQNTFTTYIPQELDIEEVIHVNSGIFQSGLIIGDLHNVVKIANMLQTLEEMLIPMRFSRSIARRVFNVDVSNMNASKAEEYLRKIQSVFKYKKYYDVQSGKINNQQMIANLVEDYWFPNRNGQKGTQVDTLNESLNLGEMGDIEYFQKKLFLALKVPIARLLGDSGGTGFSVDFNSTDTTRDEIRFMNFITRKRLQFIKCIQEMFKRQIIAKGIVTAKDYEMIKSDIKILWTSENMFLEKMKAEKYNNIASSFREYEDMLNKGWVSKEFIYKKILKFSDDDIEEIFNQKNDEKKNPIYKSIKTDADMNDDMNQYNDDEDDDIDDNDDVDDVDDTGGDNDVDVDSGDNSDDSDSDNRSSK